MPGAAQISACAIVDREPASLIASPAALCPATRRGGSRLNVAPGPASVMSRTARACGMRSAVRGSRMTCEPKIAVSNCSPESQTKVSPPAW